MDKGDRNFLRFLCFKDTHDHSSKVVVNRLCHMIFGLNASPFLLKATGRCHISQLRDKHPEFIRKIIESFCMDNLVTGVVM